MAHNLDFQRGQAAFVSLKQKAWHGLGRVIEREWVANHSSDTEILETLAADQDWDVRYAVASNANTPVNLQRQIL